MRSEVKHQISVLDVDGTLLQVGSLWLAARRTKTPRGSLHGGLSYVPWLIRLRAR